MASFDPTIQKTNDPSYLGYSQGTDKANLQPLATVPDVNVRYEKPDYKANNSWGKLLEGAGEDAKAGMTLTDNVIKKNIDDTLNTGINKIRDSFGVAAAADQSSGVAKAAGQSGAEGVSLTDETKDQPLAINRLGNRLDGLKEAYKQGELSNSAYYSKMDSFTRQVIAQYPGYENEVRELAASKLGVNSANATRAALLDDVTKLATKVQSQNDKWTAYEHTNADAIAIVYGGYGKYQQAVAEGKTTKAETEAKVANYKANETIRDSRMKSLSLSTAEETDKKSKGLELATTDAVSIANKTINTLTVQFGLNAEKMQQLLTDVNSGKRQPLTAGEKKAISANYAIIEQQMGTSLDNYFARPINPNSGDPTTIGAFVGKKGVDDAKAMARSKLDNLKAGLFDEKFGTMAMQANHSKAMEDAGTNSILNQFPALIDADNVHKRLGDSGVFDMFRESPRFREPVLSGFQQYNWGKIATGGSSIRSTIEDIKRDPSGTDNGDLNGRIVRDTLQIIRDPSKMADPTIAKDAVQHMFGPDNRTLIEGIAKSNRGNAIPYFNEVYSPVTTKAVAKMDSVSKQTYQTAAENDFMSVFNRASDDINQRTASYNTNGNLKLNFNPDSKEFYYTGSTNVRTQSAKDINTKSTLQAANDGLQSFNSAIKSIDNVWNGVGKKDTTQELYRLLPAVGIEPGSSVYKAIQSAQPKEPETK